MYIIVGTSNCPGCLQVEKVLKEEGALYIKQNVDELDPVRKLAWSKFLQEELNTTTVPQILRYVGNVEDLRQDISREKLLNG